MKFSPQEMKKAVLNAANLGEGALVDGQSPEMPATVAQNMTDSVNRRLAEQSKTVAI